MPGFCLFIFNSYVTQQAMVVTNSAAVLFASTPTEWRIIILLNPATQLNFEKISPQWLSNNSILNLKLILFVLFNSIY